MSELIPKEDILNIKNHFIITKQRSGSTLLGFMLSGHSSIKVINEENLYFKFKEKYSNKIFNNLKILNKFIEDLFNYSTHEDSIQSRLPLKDDFLNHLEPYLKYQLGFKDFCNLVYHFFFFEKKHKKIKIIINKDIAYHYKVKEINKHFPGSKVVLLVRDSPSNIYSCLNRNFGNNILIMSYTWNKVMQDILALKKKHPKDNQITLKYEELILSPEESIRKICTLLELEFEPAMMDNESHGRKVFNYYYNRTLELTGMGPKPLESDIHLNSRRKINKNKIKNYSFEDKDLKKIYFITNKKRVLLGYENKPSNWKYIFPLNPFYVIWTIFKAGLIRQYFRSGFYTKVIFRKLNIFNFFNKRRNKIK